VKDIKILKQMYLDVKCKYLLKESYLNYKITFGKPNKIADSKVFGSENFYNVNFINIQYTQR